MVTSNQTTMSLDSTPSASRNQLTISYPRWFGGSASCMAVAVSHPFDLSKKYLHHSSEYSNFSLSSTYKSRSECKQWQMDPNKASSGLDLGSYEVKGPADSITE